MISGRGLGPTGGTLDKLEAIPGFRTTLAATELSPRSTAIGLPSARRPPTSSPPTAVRPPRRDRHRRRHPAHPASIMSKKLAGGVDALVLDVRPAPARS